jgi:vacuolar-type H+-ATPase subunit I/STV1
MPNPNQIVSAPGRGTATPTGSANPDDITSLTNLKKAVARNPNTDPNELKGLADVKEEADSAVRAAAIRNKKLEFQNAQELEARLKAEEDRIARLASDSQRQIAAFERNVQTNPQYVPGSRSHDEDLEKIKETLDSLSANTSPLAALATKKAASAAHIDDIAKHISDTGASLSGAAASHVTKEAVTSHYVNNVAEAKRDLALSEGSSEALLRNLSADPDKSISEAAKAQLRKRFGKIP